MKKLIVCAAIVVFHTNLFAQGQITNISFYSNTLNKNKTFQIYLPEGYDTQDSIRYPVIYFLHGAFGDHNSYPQLKVILDNQIGNSTISPTIVVTPDASFDPWGGTFYTNSEVYGNFEDYMVFDLVEYIDFNYKTIPVRDKRAIMGHSMGGYGSMKLGLKHPDIYCGVASHSGPLDFSQWYLLVNQVLLENGRVSPYHYIPSASRFFTAIFYLAAGAFSPNLNSSPYQADFPLDSNGNFIDSTFNKWLMHDPVRLASNLSPNSRLSIYFDCGRQDELHQYSFNDFFADSLDVLGINYTFKSYSGDHSNKIYTRIPIALSFLDSVMSTSTHVIENTNPFSSFNLSQNYPNPFNPSTEINYSIPIHSFVTLKVFDVLGREIKSLVNKEQPQGNYEVVFDASGLTSGIYFYRIQAGEFVETKKMILKK